MGKESTCNAGEAGDAGSIPGSGRSPGAGHGNPLQYYCLENPTDRSAWRSTTIRVAAKSRTQLKQLNMHAHVLRNPEMQGKMCQQHLGEMPRKREKNGLRENCRKVPPI